MIGQVKTQELIQKIKLQMQILLISKWTLKKLESILVKIGETEVLMKKNSNIRNDIVIKDLILSVTNRASTSS